ncbi:MAG: thiamine pyrophosphate-dependent enzyme, partial [Parvibaculum sp.]
ADPDLVVPELVAALGKDNRKPWHEKNTDAASQTPAPAAGRKMYVRDAALGLKRALGDRESSLLHVTISWEGEWWDFRHPLDYIGSDSGGGIGGGPGIAVGAALALKESGRLPVAVCGDGDFIMGVTALWTAVRYRIPLMIVIANNSSFFNDEVHQERVAIMRNRPVENRWIGQKMIDPELDLAGMARAQGAAGFGPLREIGELEDAFRQAIEVVEAGGVAVVDVRVEPGYPADTVSAVAHTGNDSPGAGTGGARK